MHLLTASSRARGLFAAAFAVVIVLVAFAFTQSAGAAWSVSKFNMTPSPSPVQAGGHPKIHYDVDPDISGTITDDLKSVVLDFPAGLLGNPEAASPKCAATGTGSANKFANDSCPASSYIGSMSIKWREPLGNMASAPGSVYVLTPATSGSAATIGFIVRPQGWRKIFLKTEVGGIVTVRTGSDADYGLTLTVDNIPRALTSTLGFTYPITVSTIDVDINERAGGTSVTNPNGPYFAFAPTRCDAASTRAVISSYGGVDVTRTSSFTPTGCGSVPFTPTGSVTPTVTTPGASTGVNATFSVPTADASVQQSHVRAVSVDLPPGTGLDMPAIGAVSALCSTTQLDADSCPAGSKIGTASAVVPFLPPTMTGDIYLMTRNSSITFGYVLRSSSTGIKAPLKGSAAAVDVNNDGAADLVRAIANQLPQVPWSSVALNFTSKLVKNPTCSSAANVATSTLVGWSGASKTLTNSWSIASPCPVAPTVAITSPTNGSVTGALQTNVAYTVNGAASIPSGTTCSVNGVASTSATTNPVSLQLGANTISVQCTNAGGTGSAFVTITRTSPPPLVSITAPANGSLTTASITNVVFTVNGASSIPSGYACAVNGTATTSATSNPVSLAVGANTITVSCSDSIANTGSATVTVTRGNPPGVAIVSPTNASSTTASVINVAYTVNGSSSIPGGTTCTINGLSSSSATANSVPLAVGGNTIAVTCANQFGPSTTSIVVTRLSSSFGVTITSGPSGTITSTSATFEYQASEQLQTPLYCPPGTTCTTVMVDRVTLTCALDGGATFGCPVSNPYGGSYTASGLTSGPHQFCVYAKRLADNATAQDCRSFSVQTTPPPVVVITSPPNGFTTSAASIPVVFTVNGSSTIPAGTTCAVNGNATASTTVTVNLSAGTNTIVVACTNAGGTGSAVVSGNIGGPPSIVGPQCTRNGTSVVCTWTLSGTQPITTTCSVDGGAPYFCTSPANFTIPTTGNHSIQICATNAFGTSPCFTATFTGGLQPTVAITSPINGGVYPPGPRNVSYTVNATSTIPSGTTCTVNGVASTSATTNTVTLAPGTNVITVTCSNAFGSDTRTVTVSTELPSVTITAPANNSSVTSSTVNVAFTVGGSTTIPAGTACSVNGTATPSAVTNTVNLALGANTVTVSCATAFGTSTATVTVTRVAPPAFAPTFSQTLSNPVAGQSTSIRWDVTAPAGSEAIRRMRVTLSPSIGPNFTSFGGPDDTCSTSGVTATSFNVAGCPSQAKFGTATFTTPSGVLNGDVYLIGISVIPRFGIDVPAASNGGVGFQTVFSNSIPQVDPSCDPLFDVCETNLALFGQDLPDIGITSYSISLGGVARSGSNGPLDPNPFVITSEACPDNTTLTSSALFLGYSTGSVARTDTDTVSCSAIPPQITLNGVSQWTQNSSLTLNYDVVSFEPPTCTVASGTTVPLVDGPNAFPITCTNAAGSTTVTARTTRDNHAPTIVILGLPPGPIVQSNFQINYTVTDDWDPNPICTPPNGGVNPLVVGPNVFTVTCTDHAGNSSSASVVVTRVNPAPGVSGTCSPNTGSSTCSFTITNAVGGTTATCQLDSGSTIPCTSPYVITGLAIGSDHTLRVCVTNPDGQSACTNIPIIHADPGPASITTYARPSIGGAATGSVAFSSGTGECRVDGGAWSACSSPWTIPTSGLTSPAEHTYEVRSSSSQTTPAKGYFWLDNRPYNATATVTALGNSLTSAAAATNAGAHPDVTASVDVQGYDDVQSLTVKFPDGLMGSLSSIPAANRCSAVDPDGAGSALPQWQAGACPASSKIGSVTGLIETGPQGATNESGDIYLVDAPGIPSQYAAAVALEVPDVGTGLGDLYAIGYLKITDNGRNVVLDATNVPRTTSTGVRVHLRSGSLTVNGDVGGAANPLITNPHFCGPINPNRAAADDFVGTGTSYEGNTTPTITVNYPVTNCAALSLSPTITSSLSSTLAGSQTALTSTLTLPAGNSTLRTVQVKLPPFVAPNFASFGAPDDQCPAGEYTGGSVGSWITSASAFGAGTSAFRAFTPVNCPSQSRVGTATITTPLLPGTITADVYLINASPIPYIGIYVDPTKYGNPQGVTLGLFGTTATPQVDASCDPLFDTCPTQITATFASIPDVAVSSMTLSIGTVSGRVSSTSGPLPPEILLIASPSDPTCVNAGLPMTSLFISWSATTQVNRSQTLAPTGCNQ